MINLPIDCNDHTDKLHLGPCKSPKLLQSFSDVKPPTLNSSFLLNGQIQNNVYQNSWKQPKQLEIEETIPGGMKKSKFYSPPKFTEQREPTKKIIRKFLKNLMQKAYIYKESLFNQFSRSILIEKYLEVEDQNDNQYFSKWCYFLWQTIIFFLIWTLLFLVPFQVGFQLENEIISSHIFNLILASEILTFLLKLFSFKEKKQQITIMILISTIQFISFTIIQFNSSNMILILLCLVTQFFSGMTKLQLRYETWKIQLPCDLDFYFVSCKLILTIHFCACVWHFIGTSQNNSWITASGLEESDNYTRYCFSFYWSAAQLLSSGQGQLQIVSNVELIYCSSLILFSCWIFFHLLNQNPKHSEIKQKLKIMNQFFIQKKIGSKTRNEVRNHLRDSQKIDFEKNIVQNVISALPPFLRQDLLFQIRTQVVQSCKLLRIFSPSTKRLLTQLVQYHNYGPDEQINLQDINLYIIDTGQIQMKEYGKHIKTLQSGDYFGEYNFFSGILGKTIYTTTEQTTLYTISLDQFKQLISQNKLDHERFMFIKDSLQNGNFQIIDLFCYSCDSRAHLIQDCHLINYKPNIQRLIRQATQGEQVRQEFNRNPRIAYRSSNQALLRLNINQDALKLVRQQDSSSEEYGQDDYSSLSRDQSSDQNKSNENLDHIKSQDQVLEKNQLEIDNSDILIIRSPGMINTPQFQPNQHKFSFIPKDAKISPDPISSHSNEGGFPSAIKNYTSIYDKSKFDSQQRILSPNVIIKQKRKDEDPDSSLRFSEDQLSVPFIRHTKQSIHSMPSRHTILRSTKKFSSKLSSIKNSDSITNFRTNFSSQTKNDCHFPTYRGVIDLSMQHNDLSFEEFETMYNYTIYFPLWNISSVLSRLQINSKGEEDIEFSKRSSILSAQRMIFLMRESVDQQTK